MGLQSRDEMEFSRDQLDPYIELHPAEGHKKLSPTRETDHITIIDRHSL